MYISGWLVLILCVLSYLYYIEYKEEQRQFERFVNHFYHYLDSSIVRIDWLIENKPEGDALNEGIHRLERDLLKTNTIVDNGNNFLSEKIYPTRYFRTASHFLYGYKMTGDTYFVVPPLAEDGQLSEKELILMKSIRNTMVDVKETLYSPETGQEDSDITQSDFKEIILNHLKQHASEIYKKAYNE